MVLALGSDSGSLALALALALALQLLLLALCNLHLSSFSLELQVTPKAPSVAQCNSSSGLSALSALQLLSAFRFLSIELSASFEVRIQPFGYPSHFFVCNHPSMALWLFTARRLFDCHLALGLCPLKSLF